jgi:class 3 adenylate cyclase
MNILIKPFQADLLLLAIDATGVGKLEQRLMQQRNELALLTNQLEKSRSQLLGMATRFMPGQVFDSLLLDRVPPSISGSRREATIVFADLRGFSQWSQDREPEESFRMLNLFFSQSIRIVQEYNGTLDKFLGDGFMTIFNAPHDQPDHIQRAVNFAEEISRLENDGLRFGVGIHSGVVMSGNIGTDQVMNYTVLGHTVNLAKRIEETAVAGEVLMTETIAQHIRYDHEARFIRRLAWNENQEPVSIYCLVQQSK